MNKVLFKRKKKKISIRNEEMKNSKYYKIVTILTMAAMLLYSEVMENKLTFSIVQ